MRYRKDCACLDKSSSGEVISQRSRVRRFYDFNTVWGRKVRHDPFKIGEAGAVPVTPTTFKKMKNFSRPPLQMQGECGIICVKFFDN